MTSSWHNNPRHEVSHQVSPKKICFALNEVTESWRYSLPLWGPYSSDVGGLIHLWFVWLLESIFDLYYFILFIYLSICSFSSIHSSFIHLFINHIQNNIYTSVPGIDSPRENRFLVPIRFRELCHADHNSGWRKLALRFWGPRFEAGHLSRPQFYQTRSAWSMD